jgi:hypothetical protein
MFFLTRLAFISFLLAIAVLRQLYGIEVGAGLPDQLATASHPPAIGSSLSAITIGTSGISSLSVTLGQKRPAAFRPAAVNPVSGGVGGNTGYP